MKNHQTAHSLSQITCFFLISMADTGAKLCTKEQEVQEMAQVRLNKSSLAKDATCTWTVNTATSIWGFPKMGFPQ